MGNVNKKTTTNKYESSLGTMIVLDFGTLEQNDKVYSNILDGNIFKGRNLNIAYELNDLTISNDHAGNELYCMVGLDVNNMVELAKVCTFTASLTGKFDIDFGNTYYPFVQFVYKNNRTNTIPVVLKMIVNKHSML